MSLRERKKEDTRRALMREALRLFAERGYDRTTVEEIAAAADVSPRTFFRYFPAKADVLFADFAQRVAEIARAVEPDGSGRPMLARVRAAVRGFAGEFALEPELFTARAQLLFSHPDVAARTQRRFAEMEDVIRAAVAHEVAADADRDVAPRLAAAIVTASIRSTALTWTARGGSGDPRELVDASFDLIENGLGSLVGDRAR